jgi:glycosyltransferase involved in cell wall biosynthesis
MSIDIIILAKNEAKNLPDCLGSIKGLGQAIVIDDHSTDETVSLAQEAGALVYERKLDNFSAQRNFALTKSQADWVFFLDADERCSPELLAGIKEHISGPKAAGKVLRRNFAFGRKFRFGHLSPDWVIRLFPKGTVEWSGAVHENPETSLPVKPITGHMEHHTYRNWEHFLAKTEHYARLWAAGAKKAGKKSSVLTSLIKAKANFIKTYIIKLGFLDGPCGLAVSLVVSYYTLSKYLILSTSENDSDPSKK